MKENAKAAFTGTLPILPAYVVVGAAFGMLLNQAGFNLWWSLLVSLTLYSGTMEFVLITLLTGKASCISAALVTLAVNFRHVFYGFSMLDKFSGMGIRKPYMVFSLTDETYSLLCVVDPPNKNTSKQFYFLVALMDQIYWVSGCVLGALFGKLFTFNTMGIEFAMTALFVVTCTEQWEKKENRPSALIGFGAAIIALAVFDADGMIIPGMLAISALLLTFKNKLGSGEEKKAR